MENFNADISLGDILGEGLSDEKKEDLSCRIDHLFYEVKFSTEDGDQRVRISCGCAYWTREDGRGRTLHPHFTGEELKNLEKWILAFPGKVGLDPRLERALYPTLDEERGKSIFEKTFCLEKSSTMTAMSFCEFPDCLADRFLAQKHYAYLDEEVLEAMATCGKPRFSRRALGYLQKQADDLQKKVDKIREQQQQNGASEQ